jgi:hypothetical protein
MWNSGAKRLNSQNDRLCLLFMERHWIFLVSTVECEVYSFNEQNAFCLDAVGRLKESSKYEEMIFPNFSNFEHTDSFKLMSTEEVIVRGCLFLGRQKCNYQQVPDWHIRKNTWMLSNYSQRMERFLINLFLQTLYLFQAVSPTIIRST